MKTTATLFIVLFLFAGNLSAQLIKRTAVYFETGSSVLDADDKRCLDSIATTVSQNGNHTISLRGYTDSVGTDENNDVLAANRCTAVRTYLLSKNVPATSITVESFGEDHPVAANNSSDGRAKNRRVEIKVRREIPVTVATGPVLPEPKGSEGDPSTDANTGIILKPGSNVAGGYGLEVITNTNQMQALNLTTNTTDNQPMISNVMVCITSRAPGADTTQPVKVLVPASFNPYCRYPDAKLYDSQADTTDANQIKWMPLLFPDMKPVMVNGVEYYEWTITSRRGGSPCKNADCPSSVGSKGKIKVPKKYEIVSLSVIYPDANALFRGRPVPDQPYWEFDYLNNDSINSPQMKIVVMNEKGKLYTANVLLRDLKQKKNGVFVMRKKMFAPKA